MSATRPPLCLRFHPLVITAFALLLPTVTVSADIVDSATGQIDLKLRAFFSGSYPDQTLVMPVGLADTSATIDGSGYYSVGGNSHVEYNHLAGGPGQAWLTAYVEVETANEPDGGGGHAKFEQSFFAQAPFYYRLEAEPVEFLGGISVTFNGTNATAGYDGGTGEYNGTFPYKFFDFDGSWQPVGFETYVDEGFLPAGLYDLSVHANSYLLHGFRQPGACLASLMIHMQGDADLDGFVGLSDLDIVLANWNDHVPVGAVQFGDLNRNGLVGLDDLDQILLNWNNDVRVAVVPIPEPFAGMLLGVVGLGLICRRSHQPYKAVEPI